MPNPQPGRSTVKNNIIHGVSKGGTAIHIETDDEVDTDGNSLSDIGGKGIVIKKSKRNQNSNADTNDKWYKRPLGIVVLSVTGGTIVTAFGLLVRHLLGL